MSISNSVTHLAGPVVTIRGRAIQRCVVCGEKLCDSLNTAAPLESDGSEPIFPTWQEQAFVQMEGNRTSQVGNLRHTPLPDDFCLALVEQ